MLFCCAFLLLALLQKPTALGAVRSKRKRRKEAGYAFCGLVALLADDRNVGLAVDRESEQREHQHPHANRNLMLVNITGNKNASCILHLGAFVVLFADIFLPVAFHLHSDLRFAAWRARDFFGFGGIKYKKSQIFE
jgi:hypothetical protein